MQEEKDLSRRNYPWGVENIDDDQKLIYILQNSHTLRRKIESESIPAFPTHCRSQQLKSMGTNPSVAIVAEVNAYGGQTGQSQHSGTF